MSFLLANLFAPTAAPGAAGGVVGAAGQGNTGAFAEALKAFRASAPEGTGEAGAVIPGQALGLQVQGAPQAATGSGQPKTTTQTIAELSSQLNIDPAVLQRIQAGTATSGDIETLKAALVEAGVIKPAEDDAASTDETAAVAGVQTTTPVAAAQTQTQTPPPQTDPDFAAAPEDNVEMALRIADEKRPYVPPRPDLTPTTTDPETPSTQLSEGRASTSAAPAAATPGTAEGAGAAKDVLAAALPRATAAASAAASAAAGTAKPDTAPPPTVPPVAAQAPIPQAAQAIASTPHVTSIQAETVTPAATAETPSTPGAAQAKPETAAATPAPVETPETPEIKIAANSTEADAANAALSALTKDKTETKPGPAQPQKTDAAQPTAVPTEGEAADAPETLVAKTVNAGEAAKKDAKPETPAPEKPVAAEKPAAPEPRAPQAQAQAQAPVMDKPIQMDTALRSVQQMQSLPAAAIPQIASEMAARARQGATRFEIRLDPPELGRVDVRIEVDSDGRVHSRLMVEKSETLDLLKADQRALERALHDAGFKSEQNSLSFSLRDDRGGQAKYDQRFQREMNVPTVAAEEEPARLAAELAYRAPMRGAGGIDMRV